MGRALHPLHRSVTATQCGRAWFERPESDTRPLARLDRTLNHVRRLAGSPRTGRVLHPPGWYMADSQARGRQWRWSHCEICPGVHTLRIPGSGRPGPVAQLPCRAAPAVKSANGPVVIPPRARWAEQACGVGLDGRWDPFLRFDSAVLRGDQVTVGGAAHRLDDESRHDVRVHVGVRAAVLDVALAVLGHLPRNAD